MVYKTGKSHELVSGLHQLIGFPHKHFITDGFGEFVDKLIATVEIQGNFGKS